jgi:hypothetical protein
MTIVASGQISLGADVNPELGYPTTTLIKLGGSAVRALYQISTGPIRLAADGYGKSYVNALVQKYNTVSTTLAGELVFVNSFKSSNGVLLISGMSAFVNGTQSNAAWQWSNQIFAKLNSTGTSTIYTYASNTSWQAQGISDVATRTHALPMSNNGYQTLKTGQIMDAEYRSSDGAVFVGQTLYFYQNSTVSYNRFTLSMFDSTNIRLFAAYANVAQSPTTSNYMFSGEGLGFVDITSTGNVVTTHIRPRMGIYMAKWIDSGALIATIPSANQFTGNTTFYTTPTMQGIYPLNVSRTRIGGVSYIIYQPSSAALGMNVVYPETLSVNTTSINITGFGGNTSSKATTNDGTDLYNAGNFYTSTSSSQEIFAPAGYVAKISTAGTPYGSPACWTSTFGYSNFVGTNTNSGVDITGIAANSTTILIGGMFCWGNWPNAPVTYGIKVSFVAKFNKANNTIYSLWQSTNSVFLTTLDYNNTNDNLFLTLNNGGQSYITKIPMASLDGSLTTLGFSENTTIASIGNPITGLTLTGTTYNGTVAAGLTTYATATVSLDTTYTQTWNSF